MESRTTKLVRIGAAALAAGAALFVSIDYRRNTPAPEMTTWNEAGGIRSGIDRRGRSGFGPASGQFSAPIREDLEPIDPYDYPLTER